MGSQERVDWTGKKRREKMTQYCYEGDKKRMKYAPEKDEYVKKFGRHRVESWVGKKRWTELEKKSKSVMKETRRRSG